MLISQIRTEFSQAAADSFWNWWFILAYCSPFFVVLVAGRFRYGLVLGIPLSIVFFFGLYYVGSASFNRALVEHAVTRDEIKRVGMDTGRVLAPYLRGVPFAVFWTGIACVADWYLKGALKAQKRRRREKESERKCPECDREMSVSSPVCPRCGLRILRELNTQHSADDRNLAENPYSPPWEE